MAAATNEQIGTRIGMSHSGVSRIRGGGRIPNLETMSRIEEATGWSIEHQSRAASNGRDAYAAEFETKVAVPIGRVVADVAATG